MFINYYSLQKYKKINYNGYSIKIFCNFTHNLSTITSIQNFGNMNKDRDKGIFSINYNHLNFDNNKKDYTSSGEFEAKAIVGAIKTQANLPFVKGVSSLAEKKGSSYLNNQSKISNFSKDLKEWFSLPNLAGGYRDKGVNYNFTPSLLISILKK
jgi:hypothetical protein